MAGMDGTAELDLAQAQRERDGGERDQHQHPEGIHVGQERGLRLHLLSDPLNGLQRVALRHEIVRRAVKRVLIWTLDGSFDQPALVELLAVCQHVGDDRDPDRAAGVARRIDQGRGLVGLRSSTPMPVSPTSEPSRSSWHRCADQVGRLLQGAVRRATAGAALSVALHASRRHLELPANRRR
jgi:hypothetical protein